MRLPRGSVGTQPIAAVTPRRALRRAALGIAVGLQLFMVVRAYGADHAVFGFQMFPESSTWQAEIVRVTIDGRIVDVRDPWPGGYRWSDLVAGRGLGRPFEVHHADAGIRPTLGFLDAALDWVAAHTPGDPETRYLEARVTYWENGRGPRSVVLTSAERDLER